MARQRTKVSKGESVTEPDSNDTRERILQAAEELLRRYGPAKTTVVDVARSLGMSHANVYRHFASKAELQEAVAARWLHKIAQPLEKFVDGRGTAEKRLRNWVSELVARKRAKVLEDPEMFATYHKLADQAKAVVDAHVRDMQRQLVAILESGRTRGEFRIRNADAAAQVVLSATARFHHPHFVQQQTGDPQKEVAQVIDVVVGGLKSGAI